MGCPPLWNQQVLAEDGGEAGGGACPAGNAVLLKHAWIVALLPVRHHQGLAVGAGPLSGPQAVLPVALLLPLCILRQAI